MHFAIKTGFASSKTDLATIREDARLSFNAKCLPYFVDKKYTQDELLSPDVSAQDIAKECICIYRSVESTYHDNPKITPQLKFTFETMFLIRAFEDSLSRKNIQDYRTLMAHLNANEKARYKSTFGAYDEEVLARADNCARSPASEIN